MISIYDQLEGLIRDHCVISSDRPLTEEEETRVCRWLAQQVKTTWPALSLADKVILVRQRSERTGKKEAHPKEFSQEYVPAEDILGAHNEGDPVPPPYERTFWVSPRLIEGGMQNNSLGFRAQGKVWMQYVSGILFIWERHERFSWTVPAEARDERNHDDH